MIESSLHYDLYYDKQETRKCKEYKYTNGKRGACKEYRVIKKPCENRNYKVKTKLQVLDYNEQILFSKIYTKTKRE